MLVVERPRADAGFLMPVETMFVLVFALVAVAFLGFLGRLHAAGVQVTAVAQAASRAASLEGDSVAARTAAERVVDSSRLVQRCTAPPTAELSWAPSPTGTWQGGAVTVTVRCTLDHAGLAGLWAPGSRTVSMSDTQPIDRYQR